MKMIKIEKVLFVSVLVVLISSASLGAKYQCQQPYKPLLYYEQYCFINGLNLTRDDYQIEPEVDNINAVRTIWLYGTVAILSSNSICEAMPNLRTFEGHLSMEELDKNAFLGCSHLESLNLDLKNNTFVKFGRNALTGLSNLKDLSIYNGSIPRLYLDLTDLKKLETLRFFELGLTMFSADILRKQINLKKLSLYSNNLLDLDVEGILKYTPNLEWINLQDNNFKCTRLSEILSVLTRKKIIIEAWFFELKHRDYVTETIDDIHCLTDQQWESEVTKLPLEQQLFYKNETKIEKKESATNTTFEDEKSASFTTEPDEPQKEQQDTKISNLEKFDKGMETLHKNIECLQKIKNEGISNLQEKLKNTLDTLAMLDQIIGVLMKSQINQILNLEKLRNETLH